MAEHRKSFSWSKDLPGMTDLLPSLSILPLWECITYILLNIYSEKMGLVHSRRHEMSREEGRISLYSLFKIVPSCCDQITNYEQAPIV